MRQLVELALDAMAAPHGYALVDDYASTRLAVIVGDRVVIGYRRGTSTAPWKLTRWSKDPAKNRPMLETWAASKTRARDAITASVQRAAAPVVAARGDGAQLLATVVAEPENLAARQVYADWLIEHGDVRGELIQTQCALAVPGLAAEDRAALEAREREILVAHRRWFEASVEPYVVSAVTRRGLIEEIAIEGKRLPAHAARLFAEHPIRKLRVFVKDAAELARITPLPQLRRITELAIIARKSPTQSGSTIGLAALARTELFLPLRRLAFDGVLDKAPAWTKLLVEMRAPVLAALRLEWAVPPEIYELLGDAATLPSVRDLTIYSPTHDDSKRGDARRLAAIRAIARRPGLAAIELQASHDERNVIAIRELAASRSIVELRFEHCTITPASIDAVRAWERLERLVFLLHVPPLELLKPLLAAPPPRLRELVLPAQPAYVDPKPLAAALAAASPQFAVTIVRT